MEWILDSDKKSYLQILKQLPRTEFFLYKVPSWLPEPQEITGVATEKVWIHFWDWILIIFLILVAIDPTAEVLLIYFEKI